MDKLALGGREWHCLTNRKWRYSSAGCMKLIWRKRDKRKLPMEEVTQKGYKGNKEGGLKLEHMSLSPPNGFLLLKHSFPGKQEGRPAIRILAAQNMALIMILCAFPVPVQNHGIYSGLILHSIYNCADLSFSLSALAPVAWLCSAILSCLYATTNRIIFPNAIYMKEWVQKAGLKTLCAMVNQLWSPVKGWCKCFQTFPVKYINKLRWHLCALFQLWFVPLLASSSQRGRWQFLSVFCFASVTMLHSSHPFSPTHTV